MPVPHVLRQRPIASLLIVLLVVSGLVASAAPAEAVSVAVTASEPAVSASYLGGCERHVDVTVEATFDVPVRYAEVGLVVSSPLGAAGNQFDATSGSLGTRATFQFAVPVSARGTYTFVAEWRAHNGNGLSAGVAASAPASFTVPPKPIRARFDEVTKCMYGREAAAVGAISGALAIAGGLLVLAACPPCALIGATLGVLGGIGGVYAGAVGYLAYDPPDDRYTELVTPTDPVVPQLPTNDPATQATAPALNALARSLARESAMAAGVLTSIERAEGAALAGAEDWEIRQMQRAGELAREFAAGLRAEIGLRADLRAALEADGFPNPTVSEAQIRELQGRWLAAGPPADVAGPLRIAGTESAVTTLRALVANLEPTEAAGPLLDLVAGAGDAQLLGSLADEMDAFADRVDIDPLGTGPDEPAPEPEVIPAPPTPAQLLPTDRGPRLISCMDEQGLDCEPALGLDGAAGVVVSPDGRHVYVAGRDDGTLAVFDRDPTTGQLRQQDPPCLGDPLVGCTASPGLEGANGLLLTPDGSQLLVASRSSDAVVVLDVDAATGTLAPRACYSSSDAEGCVHLDHLESANLLAASPDGRTLYVTSEQAYTLTVLARDPSGTLSEIECWVDADVTAAGCRPQAGLGRAYDVAVSPDGASVYVGSVRNAMVTFSRADDGRLTPVGCASDGTTSAAAGCTDVPGLNFVQDVTVSPDGAHVYASATGTGSVMAFTRGADGALTLLPGASGCMRDADATSEATCAGAAALLQPLDLVVAPDGGTLYAVEYGLGSVTAFDVRDDGSLEQIGPCVSALLAGCEPAPSLGLAGYMTLSPDGAHLYATSTSENSVTVLEVLTPNTALEAPRGPVRRVAGAGRVATAAALSLAQFTPDRTDTVVIARADSYADALAAGPLARARNAPLLLSDQSSLSFETAAEIRRLGVETALLMGRTGALSPQLEADLEALGVTTIQRIGGTNRYETAALAARELGSPGRVYVVEGANADPSRGWPDAVAVSALAADEGAPILLVERDRLPAETAAALSHHPGATIVGGTAAVSTAVEQALAALAVTTDRVAGGTRFETSVLLAQRALAGGPALRLWLATGANFPDSLAAGPAVAADGGVLLLAPTRSVDDAPPLRDFLLAHATEIQHVGVIGGGVAISTAVENELRSLFQAVERGTLQL